MGINASDSICVIFRVYNILFLIPGKYVSDIVPLPEHKRILPHSPAYITGICNSYNRNIAMIDLKLLFELDNTGINIANSNMMIVISSARRTLGLLADEVLAVESYNKTLQEDKNPFICNLICNVYILKQTNEIALELDIPKIFSLTPKLSS